MTKKIILKGTLIVLIIITLFLLNKSLVIGLLNESKYLDNSVQVIIKPEFESYLLNQSIWLRFAIYNQSGKPYQLKQPIKSYAINFDITNPNNDKIKSIFGEPDFLNMDSVFLFGGDSVESFICLDVYMQTSKQLKNKLTGLYKIKANYQGIESNTIYVNVSYPKGEDDELFSQTSGAYYPISNDDQARNLEMLLKRYKSSPYGPQLYNWLLASTINQKDTSRFLNNAQTFFDDHFNSYGSIFILNSYTTYLKSTMELSSDQIDFRKQQLKLKYKDTFVEKCLKNNNFNISKK